MPAALRLTTSADAAGVLVIYAPFVRDTAVTFEVEPPTVEEMAGRIESTLPQRPWLVAEDEGSLLGYAYAGAHRKRQAYGWSVEPSVYVAEGSRRRGVGRALYTALITLLRAQGFINAYAGVTLPNEASMGLHRTFGFETVGVYRRVGYKHGRWHDVWWGALDLAPDRAGAPREPRPVDELETNGVLDTVLKAGARLIKDQDDR